MKVIVNFREDLAQVESEYITALYSVDMRVWQQLPSPPQEKMNLNCPRKNLEQTVSRTSLFFHNWAGQRQIPSVCDSPSYWEWLSVFFKSSRKDPWVSKAHFTQPGYMLQGAPHTPLSSLCPALFLNMVWLCHFGQSQACQNYWSYLGCLFSATGRECSSI